MGSNTIKVVMPQSVTDLKRVIRRKDMSRRQTILLKYLYEADGWVERNEIESKHWWGNRDSFDAVLSALSNRVNHTEGIICSSGYEAFIERINIGGKPQFRLREEAQQAIEQVDELLDTFDRPMEKLLDKQHRPIEFEPLRLSETLCADGEGSQWTPNTEEDRLLASYWNKIGGVIVPKVHIGGTNRSDWPSESSSRRTDGLRFTSEYRDEITPQSIFSREELRDTVQNRHVEVIEVKNNLTCPVIGRVIAMKDMFERDYNPKTTEPVIVVKSGDAALEWVCRRRRIRLEIVDEENTTE